MTKTKMLLSFLFLNLTNFYFGFLNTIDAQNRFLKNVSIKIGHSNSVTQWGLSPFSEARRFKDRSVNSVFFNIQYSIPIKKFYLSIGLQNIEKGFITSYQVQRPNFLNKISYQYRLYYVELPISVNIPIKKTSLIFGIIGSYLYDDIYRVSDVQTIYDQFGNPKVWFNSNYSYQFPFYDRYKKWDFGLNAGISRRINRSFDVELSVQKHFIDVDNWHSLDLRYNLCILTGIRYRPF